MILDLTPCVLVSWDRKDSTALPLLLPTATFWGHALQYGVSRDCWLPARMSCKGGPFGNRSSSARIVWSRPAEQKWLRSYLLMLH